MESKFIEEGFKVIVFSQMQFSVRPCEFFLVLKLSLKGSLLQILITVTRLGFMSLYVQLK